MGRSIMGSSMLAVLMVALLISGSQFEVASAKKKKHIQFTYYLHDNFIPPGVTAVQTISVSGNFTGLAEFGDQTTFDSILREGLNKTSDFWGYHSGTTSLLSSPNNFFITLTADLRTPKYNGFYVVQGRFNSSNPSWDLPITGGSGDFVGASGYLTATLAVSDLVNGIVVKYDANIFL
ncbi:protein MpDIR9 [Marchantia polymorpha subsp. ruderalis]|uniref:Dirigent protein n=2 Tax=Marchantia polymorpha TaxID=3197 RepID=A0AAF6B3L4_MARPO|nr:hypothetical protein MARPO_0024s0020 [Marchantia polymorpha]BBN06598.1 hypothetical protein Mp_3g22420 [Marchantia polymorpha subsp. ruderalis]|eukprot:PTQ43498.1 hypothetical protein MARPO_0024s0020 [Marchantia polymorpha]